MRLYEKWEMSSIKSEYVEYKWSLVLETVICYVTMETLVHETKINMSCNVNIEEILSGMNVRMVCDDQLRQGQWQCKYDYYASFVERIIVCDVLDGLYIQLQVWSDTL